MPYGLRPATVSAPRVAEVRFLDLHNVNPVTSAIQVVHSSLSTGPTHEYHYIPTSLPLTQGYYLRLRFPLRLRLTQTIAFLRDTMPGFNPTSDTDPSSKMVHRTTHTTTMINHILHRGRLIFNLFGGIMLDWVKTRHQSSPWRSHVP